MGHSDICGQLKKISWYLLRKNVKLSLGLAKHHAMKAYGEWMYKLEVSGQLHAAAALHPVKEPSVPTE
jgi:hypothetical protein